MFEEPTYEEEIRAKHRNDKLDAKIEAEYAAYLDDAERGISDDWARWNDEKNSDLLFQVWKILNLDEVEIGFDRGSYMGDSERVALAKEAIREMMRYAAEMQAEIVVTRRYK
jgi:hypothetical protein